VTWLYVVEVEVEVEKEVEKEVESTSLTSRGKPKATNLRAADRNTETGPVKTIRASKSERNIY
jgi:hypothetical protein